MGIANIGSFAGGLMRGHLASTEERRREEEESRRKADQAYQEEQRTLFREEEGRKKRVREGISGLARPGTEEQYFERDPQAILEGAEGPDMFRPATRTITPDMYQDRLAGLYSREGMPELAAGAEDRAYNLRQRVRTDRLNERTDRQLAASDATLGRKSTMLSDLRTLGVAGFMQKYGPDFNANLFGNPRYTDHTVAMASTPNGPVGYMIDPKGQTLGSMPINERTIMEFIDSLTDAELSTVSPEMYGAAQTRGIQRGQLAAQQTTAAAAMRNAATNEADRAALRDRPTLTQDGSGRILVTDNSGTLLRTLGSPRPGPVDRSPKELPPKMVQELNDAAQAVDNAKTPQERQAAQQRYNNLYSLAATQMGKVLKPGEVRGNYPGSADQDPEIAMLNTREQQLLSKMTGDNYETTQTALQNIRSQKSMVVLRRQITDLTPEERIPEANKLLKQGAAPEVLQQLGFSLEEVRKARRFTPTTQTPSGNKVGGSATDQPVEASSGMETTKSPTGKTVYRPAGSDQWYATRAEAERAERAGLNRQRQSEPVPAGLTRGYE